MANLSAETARLLHNAYEAGSKAIAADRETSHIPPESFDAVTRVEQHRWFWRPNCPRLILVAESHVYTSDADLGVGIDHGLLAKWFPPDVPVPSCGLVNLVYCLGYGETGLLTGLHGDFTKRNTRQYWDIFGTIAHTGKQPRASKGSSCRQRVEWKVRTLKRLGDLGVWLLDASVHAIYLGGGKRRSFETCQALHRLWWVEYGSKIVAQCGNPILWVVGAMAHRSLKDLQGFKCQGFIYQPNARNVDLNLNWDRLMADVGSHCKSAG